MKKIIVIHCLLLSAFFIQCKKSKDENKNLPDLKKGLLAFFRLDGKFDDSTGNIQDVSYGGLMTLTKNRWGYENRALSFNGGMFSFQVNSLPGNALTISVWVKPKDLNNDCYLLMSQESAFGVYQSKSKLGLAISIPATESAMADIQDDWIHFAGTYDGKDIKTYINGKLAKTFNHPGMPDFTQAVRVGGVGVPEWLGVIDDLRLYTRVLSAEEIKILSAQ